MANDLIANTTFMAKINCTLTMTQTYIFFNKTTVSKDDFIQGMTLSSLKHIQITKLEDIKD